MVEQLTANWQLKLLAVVLAFVVWVAVTGDTAVVQDFTAPLQVIPPDDRALNNDPPTAVTVRLRGPEAAIRRVDPVRLSAQVPLGDILGEREISLSSENLSGVPRGLKLDFLVPDRVIVGVERKQQRRVPVEPTFVGNPPEGFVLLGSEVRPRELQIVGPESEVSALDHIATNPIPLHDLTQPVTLQETAVPGPPHVQVVNPRPLNVRVVVYERPVERTFREIPVVIPESPRSVEPTQTTVDATVSGPPSLLDRLLPAQFSATLDLEGLAPRTEPYLILLRIDLGNDALEDRDLLSVKQVLPERLGVRITEGNTP